MSQTVADHLLARLREWGVQQVFGFPGDGINGLLAAWGRADNDPQFVQARHEEMAAFEAVGYAKFSGDVRRLRRHQRARARSTCSTASTTPSSTTSRSWRSSGRPARSAMGGSYQQEIDLLSLFKDVCSDYVQMCTVPEQLPNLIDRAIRIARQPSTAPTCLIFPSDVLELEYAPPGHAFKEVPSSLGHGRADACSPTTPPSAGRRPAQRRREGRAAGRPGRPRLRRRAHRGRRPARRRRGQGAARQGRAARHPALGHRLDRPARHDGRATS